MIAVDTSALISFLREEKSSAANLLRKLETEGHAYAIPAICAQEVLQGAKDERDWRLLKQYFETQTLLNAANPIQTHIAAARIYFDCRRRGVTVRSTADCYIAQLCLEHNVKLLHNDSDYLAIAKVRPLKFVE